MLRPATDVTMSPGQEVSTSATGTADCRAEEERPALEARLEREKDKTVVRCLPRSGCIAVHVWVYTCDSASGNASRPVGVDLPGIFASQPRGTK